MSNFPTQLSTITPPDKRPGHWRSDDIVDLRALTAKIDNALSFNVGAPQEARVAILDHLSKALFRGRLIAQERLQQGADGLDTARLLSSVQDSIIAALHYAFLQRDKTDADEDLPKLCIIATGGYGRGVLAPNSDVDLLFLTEANPSASLSAVIEQCLYALWDLKLKIGHATRTFQECVTLAKEDVTIKTALLDARLVAGDSALFQRFVSTYDTKIRNQSDQAFLLAKLAERDANYGKTGRSPYVVEPNVKEGMGGLRDLQTLFWVTKYYRGGSFFEDVLRHGKFSTRERRIFMDASRFLWTVRCHLHFLTGRAEDRLSFDVQPEIAHRMAYATGRHGQSSVERFMKRYFRAARNIGALMRLMTAQLETEIRTQNAGVLRLWGETIPQSLSRKTLPKGYEYDQNKIQIVDIARLFNNPSNILKVFLLARDYNHAIHPRTLSGIRAASRKISPQDILPPEVSAALLDCILGPDVEMVLRQLTETDVLGRLLPEYGSIVAQTQFNMYHHFTIDEHTMRAVGGLAAMETGRWDVAKASSLFGQIQNRRALYLAMLLHDTGKGHGDQQVLGEKTAKSACARLNLPEEEIELVGWLVRNHLEMSDTAQKRDLSDPHTIAEFVERVQSVERLNLLYLLTCADINAVGPGVFNTWKAQLLLELHAASLSALGKDAPDEALIAKSLQDQAHTMKRELQGRLGYLPTRLVNIEAAYWTHVEAEKQARHADWLKTVENAPFANQIELVEETGLIEIAVVGSDRPGLFKALLAAIASLGGNIVTAHIFSDTEDPTRFFDLFYVDTQLSHLRDSDLQAWREAISLQELDKFTGADLDADVSRSKSTRQAAFIVPAEVSISQEISTTSTVIEITAANHNGVLWTICDVLSRFELSLISAHISSFGERVFDVFYVQTLKGEKVRDNVLLTDLEAALLKRLKGFDQHAPHTAIRKLERSLSAKSY